MARAATRLNEPSPKEGLLPERDFAVGVLNARGPPLALVAHGAAEPLERVRRDGGVPGERLVGVLERRVFDAAVAHDAPVHALAAGHDDLLELIPARQSRLALLLGSGSFDEHFAERPLVAPPFAVVVLPDGEQEKQGCAHAQGGEGDHPPERHMGIVVI